MNEVEISIYLRDGTGQDFLDPTRPVNFKIIDRPVNRFLTGPVDRYFLQMGFVHCSMYRKKNFQKGGHEWGVKICDFGRGFQKKRKNFLFFFLQKWLNFKTFFYLSFGLKGLFWAAQNVHKISIKTTGGHKLNYIRRSF